ncbi:unnamed protein product [Cercopithifilaria johnstoni]|uniref:Uncharacterized protein n=1 Tax=Cercopithifilaria johnstoni TaxID=2874296 RepID=A0A8J2LVE2_9BILA|nr:unnamed protein product [Cercopithifilaria johnstoni]
MEFKEVDLETPAGTLADSLAQIFMMTTRDELRKEAYRMVGVENNRDFALAVEARLNEYFKNKQRKLDRRSILKIREEKDGASIILEHFLKTAGLPPDAVKKFSSKNLCARIKKLEKTVNQRSFAKSYLVEMKNNDPSTISGYQGPNNYKRKELGSVEAGPPIIGDEFSDSSEDEVSNTFLSKKRRSVSLSRSRSFRFSDRGYVLHAEMDVGNGVERKENLKSCNYSMNFDEFSDFSDGCENESPLKIDVLKRNRKNQLPASLDAEFSSSDDTDFSSTNDTDFP